jgi:NAD(P)-dependent dehydrogenase (short-subunit alcohol dehydrogenase family)
VVLPMMLAGKTAVVTGSGGGAGRNTARTLAAEGAKVVVNDIRDGAADQVAAEIRAEGGEAVAVTGSVADADDARRMMETCMESFGRLDVLVNNAGVLRRHLVQDTPVEDWDRTIAVNLRGTFLCSRAAIPHLIESGAGRIVNMTSTAGLAAIPGTTAYAASKGGIAVLTALLAKELVFHRITVNAVEPLGGLGASSMGADPMSVMTQRVRLAHGWAYPPRPADAPPLPDIPIPSPVGALIAYLASDDADYVNGQIIGVMDTSLRLWSTYQLTRELFLDGDVTPELLQERFRSTIGQNMANPIPDLPELP